MTHWHHYHNPLPSLPTLRFIINVMYYICSWQNTNDKHNRPYRNKTVGQKIGANNSQSILLRHNTFHSRTARVSLKHASLSMTSAPYCTASLTHLLCHLWVVIATHSLHLLLQGCLCHLEGQSRLTETQVLRGYKAVQENVDTCASQHYVHLTGG